MNIQLGNDEIVAAVSRAVEAKLPGQKVERVQFTRNKGGGVRADVVTADAPAPAPQAPATFDAPAGRHSE